MRDFILNDEGVFYVSGDKDPEWICSKLEVLAETRSEKGDNWGRLLLVTDGDGRQHEVAIPMLAFAGDGAAYRELLLDKGLRISPSAPAKSRLALYIMRSMATQKARSVPRIGWHDETFVLPSYTCNNRPNELIRLQTEGRYLDKFQVSGSLDEWKKEVAARCTGNSRLVFAVSAAFAAPLLNPLGEESGGFHYRGGSSTGKTTALLVAGSAWGGGSLRGFVETWRATTNGLESVASLHCDALLVLDEIGQIDPRRAGEAAYMLANGTGKSRANTSGSLREKSEWRLLFVSSGEIGLADLMAHAGEQIRAGQDARMADIPADAGRGMGIFENLHEATTADAFSRSLRDVSLKYYGSACRHFIEQFVKNRNEAIDHARTLQDQFVDELKENAASGEVFRVARRFGLIAAAGELAIKFGTVSWDPGEALRAACLCYLAWLDGRGGYGSSDDERATSAVRKFLQQYGTARFPLIDGSGQLAEMDSSYNRAGFRRSTGGDSFEWLILGEVFTKEVCAGFDSKTVCRALKSASFLKTDNTGKNSVPRVLPNIGRVRVYVIGSEIMEENKSEV